MTASTSKAQSARRALKPNPNAEPMRACIKCATDCPNAKPRRPVLADEMPSGLSDGMIARTIEALISDERFASRLLAALESKAGGASLLAEDILVPLDVAKQISGLGKTMIYAQIRAGKFPHPYKPGGGATRWSLHELRGWKRALKSIR